MDWTTIAGKPYIALGGDAAGGFSSAIDLSIVGHLRDGVERERKVARRQVRLGVKFMAVQQRYPIGAAQP